MRRQLLAVTVLLAVLATAALPSAAVPRVALDDVVVPPAAPPQLGVDALRLAFDQPVYVTSGPAYQAAEPSIRVDATDANQRIWVTAPTGIGVNTRSLPATPENGDLFWYSDDDGQTWTVVDGPGGVGGPTVLGGGDSDVVTGPAGEIYVTGLTLANVTLGSSCDNGATFTSNPVSNLGTVEDRQWIDGYEDTAKPVSGPDFVLNYGGVLERRIWFHQIVAPGCQSPFAGPRIDTSHPQCRLSIVDPNCYQWPGNLAVDERTGDVYVTHNTFGNDDAPFNDDVVVSRVVGGAAGPATQLNVRSVVAANDRPDTFDSFTVVAVDRASNVYVVWTERHPDEQRTDTMLAVSTDQGATWSAPVQVNRGPQTTTFPWIVAGDDGKIDIVYYGTSAKGPSPEEVPERSQWRVWMAQSLNALDPTPTFREVPATGFMHEGAVCTSGTGCAPGTRDLLDFFQVDVDAQGLANIAYTDNLNTPPGTGSDAHQEWVTFVQQKGGQGLYD
jgi:hypothetical protein